MKHEPQIQQRAAQPYVGIRKLITMEGFAEAVDTGFPEVFGWLAKHGVTLVGPPFIRYLVIDMEAELEIELAVPVGREAESDGRVRSEVLPAGRYVTLRHVGPFDGLTATNATLQQWAQERGITFDSWDTDRGSAWRGRVEHFLTDPTTEPDRVKWEVDVAYFIREAP
jgi:effector-binding domain-containing protein